jgi:hypothetical protein
MAENDATGDISQIWMLGQQQRGSELQAGARAQLIPSPLTHALSSFQGRIAARTLNMLFVGKLVSVLNYAGIRPYAMMEGVRIALSDLHEVRPLVVDPIAGFSPQFIWLAEAMPDVDFLEIDHPAVIQDKCERLKEFILPPNFRMQGADLSKDALHEVLERRAAVILALGTYLSHVDYCRLLNYLKGVLIDGGKVVGAFPYARGIENLQANSPLFARFAGAPAGIVENEQQIVEIFESCGYRINALHHFVEIAKRLRKPQPADIELLAVAQYTQ